MNTDKSELRWSVEQRLEFIEFRLFWEGTVNRSDLMSQFGISVNQASSDFRRYFELAPGNANYDHSVRTYVRSSTFKPFFDKLDSRRYLAQIRAIQDNILDRNDSWIAELPDFEAAPIPGREVDPLTLRSVIGAIRRSKQIEVQYQSLSSSEPRWRWIAPHALAFDGFRWHARAFCAVDQIFKDFLLSRILGLRASRDSIISSADDEDWNTTVTISIAPHPELSETQKKVIALDYGMRGGSVKIPVRRALLYYALKRLGLDTDPAARRPQDQQIVLLDCGEVIE